MTERRGWCPSLFDPMPSGDGLLVRVKPPRGMLSAGAAGALAEAASRHGNGTVELTRRGNLQVRGLSPESAAPFAAAMIAWALAGADPESERRRIVICSPLTGDDPSLAPETAVIAAEIERGLIAEPCFGALPAKFGIAVDGGGTLPLDGVNADIRVRAVNGGFALSVDADECTITCDSDRAAWNAVRLARAFVSLSATLPSPTRRMRGLVQAIGGKRVLRAAGLEHEGSDANFVMPGLDPGIHASAFRVEVVDGRIKSGHDIDRHGHSAAPAQARAPIDPIGFIRFPELRRGAFGLGLPFGALHTATLTTLADLAIRFGDGMLRLTPWRAVLIGGVAESDAPRLLAPAENAGLIVDPGDPRRAIIACPGRPNCSSASVTTRADAAFLAASGAVLGGIVHVSGCSKGCAHPASAEVTLVGDNGRYGLVRNGAAGEPPVAVGLTIAEVAALLEREMAA